MTNKSHTYTVGFADGSAVTVGAETPEEARAVASQNNGGALPIGVWPIGVWPE